ncbi:hypothetical protein Bpfe_028843, partial [Biomphalaria pfeifferi]
MSRLETRRLVGKEFVKRRLVAKRFKEPFGSKAIQDEAFCNEDNREEAFGGERISKEAIVNEEM